MAQEYKILSISASTNGGITETETSYVSTSAATLTFSSVTMDNISASTVSATTYQGLPIDVFTTGGTYSNGTATYRNNTGGTFSVTGFSTSNATTFTGGTVTGATNFTGGLTANTISATTYLGLPTDIRVTGGTLSAGTTTFVNNTGGTFSITGFNTTIDTFVTGFTYANNTFTLSNNTGGTLTALNNTMTGLTVNGNLAVNGTTNFTGGLTAATFSGNSFIINSSNGFKLGTSTTAGYVLTADANGNGSWLQTSASGSASGAYLPLSGGTVTGNTNISAILSAVTIEASSILKIPRLSSPPASPTDGQVYFDTTIKKFYYWNTSVNSWIGYIGELGAWKQPARVACISNINLSNPGSSIDGITMVVNDRVLVKNQTDGTQNGIYTFVGSASTMSRTTDADSGFKLTSLITLGIQEGTINAGSRWQLSNSGTIIIGSTVLDFGLLQVELIKNRTSHPPNQVPGRVYYNTNDTEMYYSDGINWNQFGTYTIYSASTTGVATTTIANIPNIFNNEVSLVNLIIKGFKSDGSIYGVYGRNVAVSKFSGVLSILQTTAEFDKANGGLNANSISFSANSGNLLVQAIGVAATTITWIVKSNSL